ncbi:GatB YqeY domain-containing protein [Levilactobacillus namurensis DSM 19117]|uniref:GatB YqeY domain-containing protein n=1 Tax=Levilactobacillus namurensis DSM 19117 TaxID=1423773 RepID=A0A0R1K741_9LACO|nr:GatB/YqeY domain-containing protein [Levilactobacillus namurensis]PTM21519.1 GatB/YqeY domain-containing protein [Lactobacillus sp. PFC-70]KRK76995.1 GatB YqeY domain-containing protein [Levilactobacillus namurensis DSM 19117]MCW3777405.1 GatB/YqeY domain-containing protein [Levilactobacillus namurensis]MDT7018528.1 GatB/YqeY domain-containing protein [Levilactobacillus namurensis]WNN64489.1 GatB/YqeY domain-containing protein [Levilactobacillus namurensis]
MSLETQLTEDLKTAMKAHDKLTLSVVRMMKAALMNEKVKQGHELTPDEELTVVSRELKQRKESMAEFAKGNRDDLVANVKAEIAVVEKYAPKQLSEDEIAKIVADSIAKVNASGMGDFGKVMGAVMPQVKGKADGAIVNKTVKAQLSK